MSHNGVSGSAGISRRSSSTPRLRRLSGLSDRELLARVKDLVSRERAVTLEILVHLIEVERRHLHVGLGYASMFDYCTRHLRYSSSAASRRIQAARCVRDYPEVYGLLQKNEINLVTISLVSSILTESNAKDLLGKIRGKSQREVEEIASAYRPPVALRDRARPVWVAEPASRQSQLNGPRGDLTPTSGSEKRPNTTAAGFASGPLQAPHEKQAQRQAGFQASDNPPSPRLVQKRLVQFVASERFVKKLERARALLSNGQGALSYEAVLEAALDEFLKDHDPEERKKRRDERNMRREERKQKAEASHKSGTGAGAATKSVGSRVQPHEEPSRLIPAAVRDAVFTRDKARCTYVGSNGKRCEATHYLEIDHIVPHSQGGRSTVSNLRLLCERHNKLEAERVLGENTTGRFRRRE